MIDLDQLVLEIINEHDYGLNAPSHVPMRRNSFRHRQRPRTAIISELAKKKILAKINLHNRQYPPTRNA